MEWEKGKYSLNEDKVSTTSNIVWMLARLGTVLKIGPHFSLHVEENDSFEQFVCVSGLTASSSSKDRLIQQCFCRLLFFIALCLILSSNLVSNASSQATDKLFATKRKDYFFPRVVGSMLCKRTSILIHFVGS